MPQQDSVLPVSLAVVLTGPDTSWTLPTTSKDQLRLQTFH